MFAQNSRKINELFDSKISNTISTFPNVHPNLQATHTDAAKIV